MRGLYGLQTCLQTYTIHDQLKYKLDKLPRPKWSRNNNNDNNNRLPLYLFGKLTKMQSGRLGVQWSLGALCRGFYVRASTYWLRRRVGMNLQEGGQIIINHVPNLSKQVSFFDMHEDRQNTCLYIILEAPVRQKSSHWCRWVRSNHRVSWPISAIPCGTVAKTLSVGKGPTRGRNLTPSRRLLAIDCKSTAVIKVSFQCEVQMCGPHLLT